MASVNPAKKNTAYTFYMSLVDQSNTKLFKASPTLAAGDVKVAIDDGAPANLATTPVVDADYTKRVKVAMSAGEMNGDNITVVFSDASGAEWCDLTVNLQTAALQFDDIPTVAEILAGVVEGTITIQGALRLALAVLTGKSSGGGTATVVFRDTGDTKNRISATVDGDGNRTAVGTRDITD